MYYIALVPMYYYALLYTSILTNTAKRYMVAPIKSPT